MRRLTKFLLGIAVVWLILWGLASVAVPKIVGAVLPRVAGSFQGAGITVQEIDFDKIEISPTLVRLSISNLSTMFDLKPTDKRHLRSKFDAAETEIYVNRPVRMRGGVIVDNFAVFSTHRIGPKDFHSTASPRVICTSIVCRLPIPAKRSSRSSMTSRSCSYKMTW